MGFSQKHFHRIAVIMVPLFLAVFNIRYAGGSSDSPITCYLKCLELWCFFQAVCFVWQAISKLLLALCFLLELEHLWNFQSVHRETCMNLLIAWLIFSSFSLFFDLFHHTEPHILLSRPSSLTCPPWIASGLPLTAWWVLKLLSCLNGNMLRS